MSDTRERFQNFLETWRTRERQLIDQLVCAASPENQHNTELHKRLVDEVLSHYQQYYHEKSIMATEDVYLFFCQPWLSSYEKSLLWIGGFPPMIVFKIVKSCIDDLTPEQLEAIERVEAETVTDERELTQAMARVQDTMVPQISMLAQRFGVAVDGEASALDRAMVSLNEGMQMMLESADRLRRSAVNRVVEILRPIQRVKFFAASGKSQLRVRMFGQQ